MKVIAFGFINNGEDSYLKDTWNIIDFVIVLISISDFFLNESFAVLKLIRTVRALKPLRIITKNQRLKVAVSSLFKSFKDIINALLMSMMFFLIFSIIFVNFFKG